MNGTADGVHSMEDEVCGLHIMWCDQKLKNRHQTDVKARLKCQQSVIYFLFQDLLEYVHVSNHSNHFLHKYKINCNIYYYIHIHTVHTIHNMYHFMNLFISYSWYYSFTYLGFGSYFECFLELLLEDRAFFIFFIFTICELNQINPKCCFSW